MTSPQVTVAIPTLQAARTLPELLSALASQRGVPAADLLILVSGSRDQTVELARAAGARIVSVDRRQFDHGGTRNLALEHSHAPFIAFLSQDAVPADAVWLQELLEPLRADALVAATWSRHLPRPQEAFFERRELLAATTGGDAPRSIGPGDLSAAGAALNRVLVFANTASCIRSTVLRAHPFPRSEFAEDRAWQASILQAGYRVVFVPKSKVFHSHAYGLADNLRRNYDDGRSWLVHFGRRPYGSRVPYPLRSSAELLACWLADLSALRREPVGLLGRLKLAFLSPLWHGSRVLGQWLGFRHAWWPQSWHRKLSLQETRRNA